jgi:hypothetical protein
MGRPGTTRNLNGPDSPEIQIIRIFSGLYRTGRMRVLTADQATNHARRWSAVSSKPPRRLVGTISGERAGDQVLILPSSCFCLGGRCAERRSTDFQFPLCWLGTLEAWLAWTLHCFDFEVVAGLDPVWRG